MGSLLDMITETGLAAHRSETGQAYARRHGVRSAPNLAVMSDEIADLVTKYLQPRIQDKVVVDVGGGLGILAMHMATFASKIFVIEANPSWAVAYAEFLHAEKPANMSFCWGAAQEFIGQIRADVAIVTTHTDVSGLMSIAAQFAPDAIDIFGELINGNPEAFDEWARSARKTA
jgi:2-polyprenyl-3-methyl-5-hydroxy-6-metoxy-1,4-benzoquinol methylase